MRPFFIGPNHHPIHRMGSMQVFKEIPHDLDHFEGDLVIAVVPEDERPLKGCNAWIDWRLYGTLTALLSRSYFCGRVNEKCLLPTYGKFRFDRLVLIGAGPLEGLSLEPLQWVQTLDLIRHTVEALKSQKIGLALPRLHLSEREQALLRIVQESHLPTQTSVFLPRDLNRPLRPTA